MLHLVPPHMLPLLLPPAESVVTNSSNEFVDTTAEGPARQEATAAPHVQTDSDCGSVWTVVLCARDKATLDECESGMSFRACLCLGCLSVCLSV